MYGVFTKVQMIVVLMCQITSCVPRKSDLLLVIPKDPLKFKAHRAKMMSKEEKDFSKIDGEVILTHLYTRKYILLFLAA